MTRNEAEPQRQQAHAASRAEVDTRRLRNVLSAFATGVIIVSAAYEGREHAMTANSFTSVSLVPPLVLFCTHNDARMTRVLERGMEIGLSILRYDQQTISRHFAGGGTTDTPAEFAWVRGVPLIRDAVAHLVCRLTDARVAGDHTVQIAEVEHCERLAGMPLVFCNGSYANLLQTEDIV